MDALVGEKVRSYREAKGMTQRELADALGRLGWDVDATAITRIEKGSRALRVNQLQLIAAVLGARVTGFLVDERNQVSQREDALVDDFLQARHSLSRAVMRLGVLVDMYDNELPALRDAVRSLSPTPEQLVRRVMDRVGVQVDAWTEPALAGVDFPADLAPDVVALLAMLIIDLVTTEDGGDGKHPEAS
ncbi:hypothetical protein CWIS_04900 [Cellulomonas sp. A375-1]|nr:hypothetical protein CWIS_04900 [Cellulomonas sp. A375-1]